MVLKLHDKFIAGLQKHGLTLQDIQQWKYAGGNKGRHLNYYVMLFGNDPLPEHKNACVCDHYIKENCYITNPEKNRIIVIGNCCIKKFMKHSTRTCEYCNTPHRNRKNNICNDCRKNPVKKCIDCNKYFCPCHRYSEVKCEPCAKFLFVFDDNE